MTTEMVNNVEMIPNLIWFQNKESVIIDINKVNSDNYDLKIDEKNFNYNTTLNNTIYKIILKSLRQIIKTFKNV